MYKEIRDLKPVSIAVLLLTLVSSWMLSLSLGIIIVGAQASEAESGEQFAAMGGLQIALTCLAVLMCLPSVVNSSYSTRFSAHSALAGHRCLSSESEVEIYRDSYY